MKRYLYTIINGYRYYTTLTNLVKNKNQIFDHITDITSKHLVDLQISILALDFDGVLNAHDEPTPRSDVIEWLKLMQVHLGSKNLWVLSNKPSAERIAFFKTYFPDIEVIKDVRKKPYPDGLEKIFNKYPKEELIKRQVALIDDRLLTGMLATCIAGCQGIYIRSPYINFKARPFVESYFQALRYLERWSLKCLKAYY